MNTARNISIIKALNRLCLGHEDWFNIVDDLINIDLKYCLNEQQRAQVIVDWVKACEALQVNSVKDEILKRYNK